LSFITTNLEPIGFKREDIGLVVESNKPFGVNVFQPSEKNLLPLAIDKKPFTSIEIIMKAKITANISTNGSNGEGGAGFSAAGFFSSAIYLHYTTNNM
jgi:hypothetical protein